MRGRTNALREERGEKRTTDSRTSSRSTTTNSPPQVSSVEAGPSTRTGSALLEGEEGEGEGRPRSQEYARPAFFEADALGGGPSGSVRYASEGGARSVCRNEGELWRGVSRSERGKILVVGGTPELQVQLVQQRLCAFLTVHALHKRAPTAALPRRGGAQLLRLALRLRAGGGRNLLLATRRFLLL